MCGIVGKAYVDASRPVSDELLARMCSAIVHRGPDDEGRVVRGSAGLAMRRLQVIDLEGGAQPMANEDGTVWLVFNGEIYNHRELRRELEGQGHVFRTRSDTEAILHLYEEEGLDCMRRLHGMFAFAIWDERCQRLLLARDRVGKKPLYYSWAGQALTFASELGALLEDAEVERQLDATAIDEYLTYLFVPHPRTPYRDVKKLPAGSYAVLESGELRVERYWEVEYRPLAPPPSFEEASERVASLLRDAVACRLEADVPIGAFLSGGLDSTLVTALMRQLAGDVRTFAIGFEDASYSELGAARAAAAALGTRHEEHVVGYDVRDLLPELLTHFGEPFADSSAIPVYHLSRVTRQSVTVALSGDGGDEVFGGYRRYVARGWADRYNRAPAPLRAVVEAGVGAVGDPSGYYGDSLRKKAKRFLEFARVVRAQPQTSWAFFLPRRTRPGSTRTAWRARHRANHRWHRTVPGRSAPATKACCGSTS